MHVKNYMHRFNLVSLYLLTVKLLNVMKNHISYIKLVVIGCAISVQELKLNKKKKTSMVNQLIQIIHMALKNNTFMGNMILLNILSIETNIFQRRIKTFIRQDRYFNIFKM